MSHRVLVSLVSFETGVPRGIGNPAERTVKVSLLLSAIYEIVGYPASLQSSLVHSRVLRESQFREGQLREGQLREGQLREGQLREILRSLKPTASKSSRRNARSTKE